MLRLQAALAVVCLGLAANAQSADPDFADFHVDPAVRSPEVRLVLQEPRARRHATELKRAATLPVDFAGHYVLARFGCGAGCLEAAAIDVRSGRVVMLPFTVSNWPLSTTEPLTFRADSRLLRVEGSRDENGQGVHFYVFDGSRFWPWRPNPR